MANVNTPFGLKPIQYAGGSPWNGQARRYHIPSTDGNAFAIGDPVKLAGSSDTKGVASITLCAAGGGAAAPILGVIVGAGGVTYGGMSADPGNLNTTVIPATKAKDYYVLVADDPDIVFEIQEIGTGTALAAAAVGLNANFVAGTNSGYLSGFTLGNDAEAATATLDLKLLGLVQRPGNAFGAYAKWEVQINNHQFRTGVAGL